jgi:hypothetical protein
MIDDYLSRSARVFPIKRNAGPLNYSVLGKKLMAEYEGV